MSDVSEYPAVLFRHIYIPAERLSALSILPSSQMSLTPWLMGSIGLDAFLLQAETPIFANAITLR